MAASLVCGRQPLLGTSGIIHHGTVCGGSSGGRGPAQMLSFGFAGAFRPSCVIL